MSHGFEDAAVATARANYERWASSAHTGAHARRTAATHAAFFLPHLKPGMAVLDAGCGPGSITLGLALAVAPGRVIGVDVSETSLERARQLAVERGATNVEFQHADLRKLPFESEAFDAVFVHFVLQHVASPGEVLGELSRVLGPGGVIGVADADFDGAIFWPNDPLLHRATEIMAAVRPIGDPRIGKQLRGLLVESGFERVTANAVASSEGDSVVTAMSGAFSAGYWSQEPFLAFVEAAGIASRDEMLGISAAWKRWGDHPAAFAGRFGVQAVGFKPQ